LYAHAALVLYTGAIVCHGLLQGQCRAHGPLWSLLHGQRRTKKRHQAVTGEFVHRPFIAVYLMDKQFIEFVHQGKERLFAHLRTEGSIAGNVGKQHGDQLALARQASPIGQDFVGQMGGEIALQLIQSLVKRGRAGRRQGSGRSDRGRTGGQRQRLAAVPAEARTGCGRTATGRTGDVQGLSALFTKPGVIFVGIAAGKTNHGVPSLACTRSPL
jgi:hypothetical protein